MIIIELNENVLFLIQLLLIITLPYILWRIKIINKYLPLVVVQILMGMAMGPSLLGKISNGLYTTLWPQKSIFIINSIGLIAAILFCFIVGMEFDANKVKNKGVGFSITALSSVILPFLLCILSGILLVKYPNLVGERGDNILFILGVAIAGSVTALPVLSSILFELKYTGKYIGNIAIGMATVNDGILWIMISIIITFAAGMGNFFNILKLLMYFTVYCLFLLIFIKPFLNNIRKYFSKTGRIEVKDKTTIFIVVITMLFFSALTTELIGVHYFWGAFMMGMITPKELVPIVHSRIDDFLKTILLPFYFVSAGLKTDFSLNDNSTWFIFAMITASATVGKILGTAFVAKVTGITSTYIESLKLGNFMSCKGLMEVIVLNILLNAKIIGIGAFSGLILMAVITTALTKPIHILLERKG